MANGPLFGLCPPFLGVWLRHSYFPFLYLYYSATVGRSDHRTSWMAVDLS